MPCFYKIITFPYVPPEILFEILARLPVKSLLRFKCVSKYFYSLISDQVFIDVHRNLSLLRPGGTTILFSCPVQTIAQKIVMGIYTINFTETNHGNLQANRVRHLCGGDFRFDCFGSSVNGLIFLHINEYKRALCNLSTRQHVSVDAQGCDVHLGRVDLGFDSIRKTYKVLKTNYYYTPGTGTIPTMTKELVLTLGVDKSWREVNTSFNYRRPIDSVHIDGIIYSIYVVTGFENPFTISAFDVKTENFSEIHLPREQNNKASNISLTEVNGGLAIIRRIPRDNEIELWFFEKSKEWKEHTIAVPLEKGQVIIRSFFLHSSKNWFGEIMLLIQIGDSYWMFFNEFGNEVWRKFKILGIHDYLTSFPIKNWNRRPFIPNVVELTESLFVPKLDSQQ